MNPRPIIALVVLFALSLVVTATAQARETNDVATIAASATESQVITLGPFCVVGLQFPPAFTGTEITGTCTIQDPTSTFGELYQGDGTTEWVVPVTINRYIDLTQGAKAICGCTFLKIVSDIAEGDVRAIKLQLATGG